MFFKKKYSFQINQNKDILTQALKNLSKENLIQKNSIGNDSLYSVEFNWDEFFVTRRPKLFERSAGIEPDAHIQLMNLSENLTRIDVKIKFSEIAWFVLIFIQSGIVAVSLFGPTELNWWSRILLLIGISGLWNFVIWMIFVQGANALKGVVKKLFEQTT